MLGSYSASNRVKLGERGTSRRLPRDHGVSRAAVLRGSPFGKTIAAPSTHRALWPPSLRLATGGWARGRLGQMT